MCKGMVDWLKDEVMEATRINTIDVTKRVTEQVTRETKIAAMQANIHAMTKERLSDAVIRKVALMTFSDMADYIEEQIEKERKILS